MTAGLHHHGEEQEHPGYSVTEMMTLCGSTNPRQRQVGLELLEAVLTKWWAGELEQCLQQSLVTELVGAGVVQVIRISLDSSETGVVMAGVKCLVSLLCCNEEERLLDWMVDTVQPGLAPIVDTTDNEDETEQDMTDHQLVTSGVYGYCRHPSYAGWFLWSVGTQVGLSFNESHSSKSQSVFRFC